MVAEGEARQAGETSEARLVRQNARSKHIFIQGNMSELSKVVDEN